MLFNYVEPKFFSLKLWENFKNSILFKKSFKTFLSFHNLVWMTGSNVQTNAVKRRFYPFFSYNTWWCNLIVGIENINPFCLYGTLLRYKYYSVTTVWKGYPRKARFLYTICWLSIMALDGGSVAMINASTLI